MNATDAAKLLSVLAELDRREFNAITAQAWAWALDDIPYNLGLQAAKNAYKAGSYVDIAAIERQITRMRPQIESDVRAAKLRGLVADDWPKTQPIPDAAMDKLVAARKQLFEANNDYPDEIDGNSNPKEID
jgi:hypothetical protein